jgi:TP901 family phage tail tape measure protein
VGARLRLAGQPAFSRSAKTAAGGLDKLGRDAAKADKKVGLLGRGLRGIGKAAVGGLATAGVAFTAFAAKGIRDAGELDTKLREVNTLFGLTGKAAEQNFGDLQKLVKGLSKEVGIAQVTLTEGLYNAVSAGIPKDNAFDFMAIAAKASVAGVTDVNTSVEGLTGVLNAFSKPAAEAEAVADMLFTTVKGGITTFPQLAANISNIAPAAAAAGVSMQEVGAAIATLTSNKVPTAQATTMLRAALGGLQKPSKDLDKIFGKLGYKNAQLAIEQKGLGFALDAVKKASKGNNGELQKLLGSVEAVGAANIIAGGSARKFKSEMDAQKKAAGSTSDAFDEMDKSAKRTFEKLQVQVQNVGIDIGNYLLPKILKLADEFQRGEGAGGKLRDGLIEIRAAAQDAWPHVKSLAEHTKTVIDFMSRHKDEVKAFALAVGLYATAMKAAATWTSAMAAINLGKLALGIGAVGTASGTAAGGVGALTAAGGVGGAAAAAKGAARKAGIAGAVGAVGGYIDSKYIDAQGRYKDTKHPDGSITRFDGKTGKVTTIKGPDVPLGTRGPEGGRARGGPVSPGQAYRVGEYGPEIFVPQTAGRIWNREQAASVAGPTGPNVQVVNHFHGFGGGPQDADRIVEIVRKGVRQELARR